MSKDTTTPVVEVANVQATPQATPAQVAPAVLTSEKLEALKQAVKDASKAYRSADEHDQELFNAIGIAQKAVQAEESALKVAALEQARKEAQAKKLKVGEDWETALREELKAYYTRYKIAKPTITMEEMNELTAKTKAAKDANSNALLGTVAKVSTPKATSETGEPKAGSKSSLIRQYYIDNKATMSKSDIEKSLREQGYNDGTINNAINDYLIEIGEKAPRPAAAK